MPRIRTIKPDFWSDRRMVKLSAYARLFYMGMWNFALCDRGHLPDDAEELKLKILPADDVNPDALLAELVDADRVRRYTTPDGETYLWAWKLGQHQKIDGRWQPRCPYCALSVSPDSPPPHPDSREARGGPPNPAPVSVYEPSPEGVKPTQPRASSGEAPRDSPGHTETHQDSPKPTQEVREGKEGRGREGSSGTAPLRANGGRRPEHREPPTNDPPGPRERLLTGWLAPLGGRAHPHVVHAVGRHLDAALGVGIPETDIAEALRLWQARGDLGPNVLPSLIHQVTTAVPETASGEVVPLHQARRSDPRPSTKDGRVADHWALVAELEAEGAT